MNSIIVKAYAKINLGLDVIRRREDGYHDVSMIMQSVDLYDTLTINKQKNPGIRLRTNLPFLPNDQRNLVYKAAALFQETCHIVTGVQINLHKKIPVAAGMAGGSSDAAAALIGLNKLFGTELSMAQLQELGVKLGADVPYCIMLGTALSEGIGDILTPLKPMPSCDILLVKPDISVSTKYVYENLNLNPASVHPNISDMLSSMEENNLTKLAGHMDNILQSVTVKDYPVIDEIKKKMKEYGALTALMSGSGPTVFGIFNNHSSARKAYYHFINKNRTYMIYLTKPCWPAFHSR